MSAPQGVKYTAASHARMNNPYKSKNSTSRTSPDTHFYLIMFLITDMLVKTSLLSTFVALVAGAALDVWDPPITSLTAASV